MESSGSCCTGPCGPEGSGGSGTFFFFRWPWEDDESAELSPPRHRTPAMTNAANFRPVGINYASLEFCDLGDAAGSLKQILTPALLAQLRKELRPPGLRVRERTY